jgi:exodeoxyribonuclease V beta subunit
MIDHVLAASLQPDTNELQLAAVGPDDRINELEFYFPLKPVSAGTLSSIFQEHGRHAISKEFPQQLDTLTFSPLSGFMKGYIDMIFQYENRYFLVDWKSNYLGPRLADYSQLRLMQTMQDNFYVLQYHIYTLALHQYLRRQKGDYCYENDFAGVFYIYIRGVDRKHGMKFGVFADIPDPALIHALGLALIPDYSHE